MAKKPTSKNLRLDLADAKIVFEALDGHYSCLRSIKPQMDIEAEAQLLLKVRQILDALAD